jgi:multimeric flavodoxin WrbA
MINNNITIVAFHGSPRKNSNSSHMLRAFLRGAGDRGTRCHEVFADRCNVHCCRGCLRCNLIKRCAIKGDGWEALRLKILEADVLVFASPVYFHHLTAPLKQILDRFRSFMHIRITAEGIMHRAWQEWNKHFVLLLAQGSPDPADAQPIIDLFTFLTHTLGPGNCLHTIVGTRLAAAGQVLMSGEDLQSLYARMELPVHLAEADCRRNQALLQSCYELGHRLAGKEE